MSWKDVLSFVFFLLVVGLLVFYWFLPLDEIEFGFSSLKRKYGNYVSGKNIDSQRAEIYCMAVLIPMT